MKKCENIVLAALNAKYIHPCPAVYSLKEYAREYRDRIRICEFTINQRPEEIIEALYRKKPDLLAFSCYIWNITQTLQICRILHILMPEIPVWLGGPEVSFEDGSFLKKATEICNRNSTQLNMIKLLRILRDSYVWVPCNAILSDADYAMIEKMAKDAESGEGLDSLKGQQFTTMDNVRLVPDILQNGDAFFFPVFTSAEEMGEYGDHFSKVEKHFLETIVLARNNEKDVTGIVINAFSEPFVVNKELFELIEGMESSLNAD